MIIDVRNGTKNRVGASLSEGSSSAGVLTTDTGLTITGDSTGNLLALPDGTSLWHENIGRMSSAPVTYELDGKQYLLVSGGNTLYAYALP